MRHPGISDCRRGHLGAGIRACCSTGSPWLGNSEMKKNAVLSDCGRYRYALWRIWEECLPVVMFIGLNPSTADATRDDPTVRRCVDFARRWGYGGLSIGNLFAYRTSHPRQLMTAEDPVGPDNDDWLLRLNAQAQLTVAAWGDNGTYRGRHHAVIRMFPRLYCLKMSSQGNPRHPLYLAANLQPQPIGEPSP